LFPIEVIGGDEIPLAFDEEFAAGMAVGVVPFMLRDIAHVDIPYSLLHGELTEAGQDGDWRCGQAVELVHGEEPQEMKRFVGTYIFQYPGAHAFDHLIVVGITGYHEVGDLTMDALFVEGSYGCQDRVEVTAVEPQVDVVTE
jgi:hypothetical protein